jgi:hypothetical protein
MDRLEQTNAGAYPGASSLALSRKWLTRDELRARAGLDDLFVERTRVLSELDARELKLNVALAEATARADAGSRSLLTEQGDRLVAAAKQTLAQLGFEVADVDQAVADGPKKGLKVEDLRLGDSDDLAWTNITEIRGYAGGAKTSDLQRIGRFAALYERETGSAPKADGTS